MVSSLSIPNLSLYPQYFLQSIKHTVGRWLQTADSSVRLGGLLGAVLVSVGAKATKRMDAYDKARDALSSSFVSPERSVNNNDFVWTFIYKASNGDMLTPANMQVRPQGSASSWSQLLLFTQKLIHSRNTQAQYVYYT